MAGIYIHIPFCKQKCHYCNFFSVASVKWRDEFTRALLKEMELRKDYLQGEPVNTVYFGGGTPSLWSIAHLALCIAHLALHFNIEHGVEITLEANPDDINETSLEEWRKAGINRLSIGIQSFFDDDLRYLNRVHDAGQAHRAIEAARRVGFDNLTIDLIYGIPGLTEEKWAKNLETFFSLDIPHLSAYALTVEQKTPLALLIEKGKYAPVDEELSVRHFKMLLEQAKANDFIHYEISNFAREGYYSKHNSLYWLGGHYLGLGPSAHSFNGHSRQWNVSNISQYIKLDEYQSSVDEKEVLSTDQRYNEYVMTSLRTVWGCDTVHIRNVFGEPFENHFIKKSHLFIKKNHLYREGTKYFLTEEGKLFADGIAAGMFR
ncbi:MAG TPA: radical SAM family heme chaperone HemW [Bacteroidales bacterium]|nr:radical SAM family heme chaperone HemW [Bacteroidales bacterium]HOX78973.1 radical SAM family heme chaperone HemW [Bacteroidales bacterium]HPI85728.1 radical SAM family heme chaperone HemW [Bacteroidales bacterium]HPM91647.1 radical SAM family heme chaperone HemW [Bacteroidales bacterium]